MVEEPGDQNPRTLLLDLRMVLAKPIADDLVFTIIILCFGPVGTFVIMVTIRFLFLVLQPLSRGLFEIDIDNVSGSFVGHS
jgi:hypothetical protein